MVPLFALLAAAWATEVLDRTDEVAEEVCVEVERDRRFASDMPDREPGFAVPEGWARARGVLGQGRLPRETYPREDFIAWVRHADPPPEGDAPLAVVAEATPDPRHPDRALLRVGLRTAPPANRAPMHVVALVHASKTMQSVLTRTMPPLLDALPDPVAEDFAFPKVDRMQLARAALVELVDALPPHSEVALAAFDRGAVITLEPTAVEARDEVLRAIDGLRADALDPGRPGLEVVLGLVRRMQARCGDTRVLVFSDNATGLGDPRDALAEVGELASHGVRLSTVAVAVGRRRVPALERLAWVGYGRHHHADTLGDAAIALREELRAPGWVARDVAVEVRFAPGVEATPVGDAAADLRLDGVGYDAARSLYFDLTLPEGGVDGPLATVVWRAASPVPGAWERAGQVAVEAPSDDARGARMAWVAGAFADLLSGRPAPSAAALYALAVRARREEVPEDLELIALVDRARRLRGERAQ